MPDHQSKLFNSPNGENPPFISFTALLVEVMTKDKEIPALRMQNGVMVVVLVRTHYTIPLSDAQLGRVRRGETPLSEEILIARKM